MKNSLSIQSLLSVLFFVVSPSLGYFSNRKTNTLNIFGGELEHCSRPGTAAAGFISGPRCIHHPIDEDYHNICLDIEEVEGGDFCDVTVQENLCSDGGTILPCTEDSEANCPVKHFCVHEEAFADYLELAGGCDKIGHIKVMFPPLFRKFHVLLLPMPLSQSNLPSPSG